MRRSGPVLALFRNSLAPPSPHLFSDGTPISEKQLQHEAANASAGLDSPIRTIAINSRYDNLLRDPSGKS
jgi:hypothetical protein